MGERRSKRGNEPVDFTRVFEQAQCDRMHGSIAPSLVEEAARAIEMLEIVLVSFTSPKIHVGDLEVAPEMTGRVAVGLDVMARPSRAVL